MVSSLDNTKPLVPGAALNTHQSGMVLANNTDGYAAIVSQANGQVVYCAFDSVYTNPLRGVIEGILRERMKLRQEIRLTRDDSVESSIMTSLRQDYQDANKRYLLAINTSNKARNVTLEMEPGWSVVHEKLNHVQAQGAGSKVSLNLPAREVFLFELKKP